MALVRENNIRYKLVQEQYKTLSSLAFFWTRVGGFHRKSSVSLSNFVFNQSLWILNSSFTFLSPHLSLFLMQFLTILFSGHKRLKTGKHKEIKSIRAGRMKTKLRIAFENFVQLKSRQQEMAVLKTREDVIEIKTILFARSLFFSWLKYFQWIKWHSGAKTLIKLIKFVREC